jgi:hypothetical protein
MKDDQRVQHCEGAYILPYGWHFNFVEYKKKLLI